MTYEIEVTYQTGDTFGSEDVTERVGMEWNTLEKAQAALKRIEEHYRWYASQHQRRWVKREEVKRPEWHTFEHDFAMSLVNNDGKETAFYPPWCGYFERLHGAKIVQNLPSFSTMD